MTIPATHRLAALIPEMSDDEYRDLREDIAAHGLRQPIVLYEGMVLDGRHRARACDETGVEPRYEEYDGDEPAAHVLSLNLHRRHLSVSQRAMIATDFLSHLQEEARQRMSAAGKGDPIGSPLRTTARAGEIVGVSRNSIGRAKRVTEQAPDLVPAVRAGEISVAGAGVIIKDRIRELEGRPKPAKPPIDLSSAHNLAVANKAKERLWTVISGLSGYQSGLEDFRLDRALAVATRDEVKNWASILRSSSTSFNKLAKDLEELLKTTEGDERLAA